MDNPKVMRSPNNFGLLSLLSSTLSLPQATMAKPTAASKKRKQHASKSAQPPATTKKPNTAATPTTDLETVPLEHDTSDLIGDLLLPEEVESTIDVLQMISKNPDILKLKEMKALKGSCFEVMRQIKEVAGEGMARFIPVLPLCKRMVLIRRSSSCPCST